MTVRYSFDLYPRTDPRDGSLIARLLDLQRAEYRGEANGAGSGLLALRGDSSDGQLIDSLGLQYVRVVSDDTDKVVGGFFLDSGNFAAITKQNTRLLTFGGAGTLSYLDRESMWSHSYIGPGAMDPFDGIWRLYAQGLFAGGDFLGAVLHRIIHEAQSFPTGTYTHRHKDGETYTDSHDDDRPESAIADLVLTFDAFEDTDGSPWTLPSGEFTAQVGESVYQVVQRLMRAGLYVELDPDTFELRAWEATGHRRDRTGTAYGSSVVRFSAGDNIKSDAKRKVTAFIQRSAILASTSEDVSALAVGPSDIPWHSGLRDDVGDVDALEQLATSELSRRSDAGDIVKLRMRLGADPSNGFYRPWEEVLPDDLVTVDSGSGQWDWDEAELPVAALEIKLREEGDWDAFAELGSVFSADPSREFQAAGISTHPHPQPCVPGTTFSDPPVFVAGEQKGNDSANSDVDITVDFADLYALMFVGTAAGGGPVTAAQYFQSLSGGAQVVDPSPESLTLIDDDYSGSDHDIAVLALRDPDVSNDVDASFISTHPDGRNAAAVLQYSNVPGSTNSDGIRTTASATGTSASPSLDVTGIEPGDMVVVCASYHDGDAGDAVPNMVYTASGWNLRTSGNLQAGTHTAGIRSWDRVATGTSLTFSASVTQTDPASIQWMLMAVVLKGSGTGTVNDGNSDLVGTATRWARCDHRHDVHRDSAPTVNDDWETAGYKLGTIWAQLDDLGSPTEIVGVWMLVDDATGAAVWAEWPTGTAGVTDHGALTGLADDDHPQYATDADLTAHAATSHGGSDGVGPILITDTPAGSPLIFDDLLQTDEGDDLLYVDL